MARRKIDKVALANLIRELDGLDNEQRADLLSLLNERKTFGLVWEEKTEDAQEKMREELPVFKEDVSKRLIDGGTDAPNHVIIEADNIHALTALMYSHEREFDIIEIDPPYNTGKKEDFKYNDHWVCEEDEYRHSKWLSFMRSRLKIAHILLKPDGILFIHVDDNEVDKLKLICDEIFHCTGSTQKSNFLGILVWNLGTGTQAGHFTRSHEYVLAYSKDKTLLQNFTGGDGEIDHSALKKISKKNPPVNFLFKAGTVFKAPDGTELTDSWGGSEKTTLIAGRMVAENGKLKYDVVLQAGFAMVSEMKSWFDGEWTIDTKGQHVTNFYFNSSGVLHYTKDRSIINPSSVLSGFGSTKSGTKELEELLSVPDKFGYPKPLSLIKFIVSLKGKHVKILDFFAGSGTTLHATMLLNKEDGGHRQCFLVSNNENNICEEVTYERNKRVIEGYTTPKGEYVEGLKDNNLRYYKVDFVPRDNSVAGKRKLMEASTDLVCIKHDVYQELDTFGSLSLKPHIARYFAEKGKQILIIYKSESIEYFVKEIAQMPEDTNILVYVFSTNNYALEADFEDVADKVTLCALPAAVYNAYLKVLPKKKVTTFEEENEVQTNMEEDEQ